MSDFFSTIMSFFESSSGTSDTAQTGINDVIYNLIVEVLDPFSEIIQYVCVVLGMCMIAFGIARVRMHGNHNLASGRLSPLTTVFSFVGGSFLLSFFVAMEAFSNSVFASIGTPDLDSDLPTTLMAYAQDVSQSSNTVDAVVALACSLLLVVGALSFIRGCYLLTRIGEGMGGESMTPKATTHIIAGVVGVNAYVVYELFSSVYQSLFTAAGT